MADVVKGGVRKKYRRDIYCVRLHAKVRINELHDWNTGANDMTLVKTLAKSFGSLFCREMVFPGLPIPKNAVVSTLIIQPSAMKLTEPCQSQFACTSTQLPV